MQHKKRYEIGFYAKSKGHVYLKK